MIETVDYKKVGIESLKQLAFILPISNSDVVLLCDGTSVKNIDGVYNVFIRMLDESTNKVTIQQTQLIERDQGVVSLATLACYETLYTENKAYFDAIIY